MVVRRVSHVLAPNKEKTIPFHFVFFDTETMPKNLDQYTIQHFFRLGVACYWQPKYQNRSEKVEWFEFKSHNQFWDWVAKKCHKKKPLILIAHSLDFDMKVLAGFEAMRKRKFELSFFINNQLCKIWHYKKGDHKLIFLDNLNFFSLPLKQLGEDIGLTKFIMPDFDEPDHIWFPYCKRDVEILFKVWQRYLDFVSEYDLGNFAKTIASQSFNAFKHRFMTKKIFIHNNSKVIDLEREAYHGGRVECFYLGKQPKVQYYLLDVNSMYPYLMLEGEYPIKLVGHGKKASKVELKQWLKTHSVIARVKLKVKKPVFCSTINKRLCFPTGVFDTVLTTNELIKALEMNAIRKIYDVSVYQKANIFKLYVEHFYKQRLLAKKQQNLTLSLMNKLMLNTLYGKFGQKNDVWEKIGEDSELENCYFDEFDYEDNKLHKYRIIEGRIEESKGYVEAYNSFPAISAEVTANGRLMLWHFIETAGVKNVFYCDTDSLIVNGQGIVNLAAYINRSKIGSLKLEKRSNILTIYAPKYYKFGGKLKIKGIKANAVQIDDHTFEQWQFETVRGALRKGNLNRQIIHKIVKSLKMDYQKGRVLKSGRVVPFHKTEVCLKNLF